MPTIISDSLAKMMRTAIEQEKKDGKERGFPLCEKDGKIFGGVVVVGEGGSLLDEFEGCDVGKRAGFFHTHGNQPTPFFSFHDYADMGNDFVNCIGNVHGDIKCVTSHNKKGGLNRDARKILKHEWKKFEKDFDKILHEKGVIKDGLLVLPDGVYDTFSDDAALKLEKKLAKNTSLTFTNIKI